MHSLSIALTISMAATGWSGGHSVIRERAITCLPAWQQELLGDTAEALCGEYSALQDQSSNERLALATYCRPEGANVSLHDVNAVPQSTIAFRWYLRRIGDAVRAGEMDEAARYLGVLCHWIEDVGSMSVHCTEGFVDETSLRELIPPPGDERKHHYL